MQLFFSTISPFARWNVTVSRGTPWVTFHLAIFLVQKLKQELGQEKGFFSNSNVEDNIAHRGKNFQTESILDTIEDDTLLDNRTWWIHEGMSETMMTWLESGPTPCRVLAQNQW
jgi:hypothetical protein